MTYLIKRGPRARRRIASAHIAKYDVHGNIAGAWCGRDYNLTSNVPWGLRRCKDCARRSAAVGAV